MDVYTITIDNKSNDHLSYSVDRGDEETCEKHQQKNLEFNSSLLIWDLTGRKFAVDFMQCHILKFSTVSNRGKQLEISIPESQQPGNPNDNVTIEDDDLN